MRRLVLAALLAAGCGDNARSLPGDGGSTADAASPDAAPVELAPCLDRPDSLARPPTGSLPCELLPPGFAP